MRPLGFNGLIASKKPTIVNYVECIETDSQQSFIQTDIKISKIYDIQIKLLYGSKQLEHSNIFGSECTSAQDSGNDQMCLIRSYNDRRIWLSYGGYSWWCSSSTTFPPLLTTLDISATFNGSITTVPIVVCNSQQVSMSRDRTGQVFLSTSAIRFFGRKEIGTEKNYGVDAGTRIYNVKLIYSGKIEYDLVAAKLGDTCGLYDLISGKYYPASGNNIVFA